MSPGNPAVDVLSLGNASGVPGASVYMTDGTLTFKATVKAAAPFVIQPGPLGLFVRDSVRITIAVARRLKSHVAG